MMVALVATENWTVARPEESDVRMMFVGLVSVMITLALEREFRTFAVALQPERDCGEPGAEYMTNENPSPVVMSLKDRSAASVFMGWNTWP
jgi:hypothetical protein